MTKTALPLLAVGVLLGTAVLSPVPARAATGTTTVEKILSRVRHMSDGWHRVARITNGDTFWIQVNKDMIIGWQVRDASGDVLPSQMRYPKHAPPRLWWQPKEGPSRFITLPCQVF